MTTDSGRVINPVEGDIDRVWRSADPAIFVSKHAIFDLVYFYFHMFRDSATLSKLLWSKYAFIALVTVCGNSVFTPFMDAIAVVITKKI